MAENPLPGGIEGELHSEYAEAFTYGPEEKGKIQREVERYFDISDFGERAAARRTYHRVMDQFDERDEVTDQDIAVAVSAEIGQGTTWIDIYDGILEEKIDEWTEREKERYRR